MPFLEGSGGRVYFRHWSAEAPRGDVVLLHGYGEHSGLYHRLAVALNLAGYDVWALDHIGHGLTAGERGFFPSVSALAENARALIRVVERSADRPLVLVGHSLGGVAASLVAISEPNVNVLILSGTTIPRVPPDAASLVDPVLTLDDFYLDALVNDPLSFDAQPAWNSAVARIAEAGVQVVESLPTVEIPVLLVNGEFDVFAPPKVALEFAATLPSATSVEISGAYHNVLNDVAHFAIERLIIDFLDGALNADRRSRRPRGD